MTAFKLPEIEEKADYVQHQFDRIARKYDLANDAISFGMHRYWKDRAIGRMINSLSGRYLDVCCGTGDLALRLAQHKGFSGQVVGVDFSAEMLKVARARSEKMRADQSTVTWIQGDALNLPFEDNTFDGAIISFGLRNLTDFQRGISEMSRVVKRGGRVVNLDLGKPHPLFAPLFYLFFDNVVPLLGELIQGDRAAYTYLPQSRKTYPEPSALTQIFTAAGLSEVGWIPLAGGSVALHEGLVT